MRDDLFSEEDVRRDIEAAWRELAAKTQRTSDIDAAPADATRSPLPEPVGLGWVPTLPPSPSRTPSPSAFYLGQVPPAPSWDKVPILGVSDGSEHRRASSLPKASFAGEAVGGLPQLTHPNTSATAVAAPSRPSAQSPLWIAPPRDDATLVADTLAELPTLPHPQIALLPINPAERTANAIMRGAWHVVRGIAPHITDWNYLTTPPKLQNMPTTPGKVPSPDSDPRPLAVYSDMANLALMAWPNPASWSVGAATAAGKILPAMALFGGAARTFPRARQPIAEALEAAGRSENEIWRGQGLWRGPGRKWRFEASDEGYNVNPLAGELDENGFRVARFLEHHRHPEAQAAYSEQLAPISSRIKIYPYLSDPIGKTEGNIVYVIARDLDEARKVGSHELQHLVQRFERFPRGGTKQEFMNQGYLSKEAYERYHKLAGEVEARNVMRRLLMSERERRLQSPGRTQDTPLKDQLILPW